MLDEALAAEIVQVLAQEPQAVSLPRLCKRLSQSASVLMRQLALMGDASVGGQPGPGWVQLRQHDGRWMVQLTALGQQVGEAYGVEPALADCAPLPVVQPRNVRVFGEAGLSSAGDVRPDWLAAEVPVAMVFNGVSHAVMMATPDQLEDFALGFALSEGIVDEVADCRGLEVRQVSQDAAGLPEGVTALEVHLEVSSRSFARLQSRRRSMAGRTGCGVCGVESLAALELVTPRWPAQPWVEQADAVTVLRAMEALQARQNFHAQTGSLHAAAWSSLQGQVDWVCEDVGRHNALDKLIGALARAGRLQEPGVVLLTSRGSHELVRKCARVGIRVLATISAPTATGVQLADLSGLRLWGLCRAPRAVLYTPGAGVIDAMP